MITINLHFFVIYFTWDFGIFIIERCNINKHFISCLLVFFSKLPHFLLNIFPVVNFFLLYCGIMLELKQKRQIKITAPKHNG